MAKELKYADKASQAMVKRASDEEIKTVWDRFEEMQPQCGFGKLGICCKNCSMGPCRIDPFGDGPQEGVCGANADTIAARNLIRMVAGGAAAHSDHGRDIAHTLLMAAENPESDYEIKDTGKLKQVAENTYRGFVDKETSASLPNALDSIATVDGTHEDKLQIMADMQQFDRTFGWRRRFLRHLPSPLHQTGGQNGDRKEMCDR